MNYGWLCLFGFLCCTGIIYTMIWRCGKSIFSQILYTVGITLIPILLVSLLNHILDRPTHVTEYSHTISTLEKCLSDSTISAEKITAALKSQDPDTELRQLLPKQTPKPALKPNAIMRRNDKINLPASEQPPGKHFYHSFPMNSGEVDYDKIPEFAKRIADLQEKISDSYWEGKGIIVTGQLQVEDAANLTGVASQTTFLADGVFAHPIYPLNERELQFFKSGYEPLAVWLDPNKHHPKRLDLGVIVLKKAKETYSLTFSLALPESVKEAKVKLQTGWPAPTWRDHGHECAAPIHRTVAEKTLRDKEPFHAGGLSGIPYELIITAPGCVQRTFYFTGNRPTDFGEIVLSPTRSQTFRQRPFSGGPWEMTTLELNGKSSLVVAPKDSLGNTVSLHLTPDLATDRILVFFPWHPVYFDDYGKVSPDILELPQPKHYQGTMFFETGHLYRMKSKQQNIDKLIYVGVTEI